MKLFVDALHDVLYEDYPELFGKVYRWSRSIILVGVQGVQIYLALLALISATVSERSTGPRRVRFTSFIIE